MSTAFEITLTPRDSQMLVMLYTYDGCVIDHLKQRFFPTAGARSACYERVARLIRAGYIASHRLPSLTGVGSGKAFMTLGPKATPLLATYLELSRTELGHRLQGVTPLFAAHHLAVCDFRLSLDLASGVARHVTLQDWISERELKRAPIRVKDSPTKTTIPLIPDGAFTLRLANASEQAFWLEMDLNTVTAKRMRTKLRGYLTHAKSDPTPILFVVPTPSRQRAIAAWALDEAEKLAADPTIFWLTTKEQINEQTILASPVWQVVGGPAAMALVAHVPAQLDSLDDPAPPQAVFPGVA